MTLDYCSFTLPSDASNMRHAQRLEQSPILGCECDCLYIVNALAHFIRYHCTLESTKRRKSRFCDPMERK